MRYFFLLFTISMFIGCQGDDYIGQRHAEVMEIHDEIMPITHVKLKKIESTIRKDDSLDSLNKSSILSQIDNVQGDMDHWMKTYKKPDKNQDAALTTKYFDKQVEILEKMRKDTYETLEDAEKILE